MGRNDAHQHALDTEYEVWRRGGNPDYVNRDSVADEYYNGYTPDESAESHFARIRRDDE